MICNRTYCCMFALHCKNTKSLYYSFVEIKSWRLQLPDITGFYYDGAISHIGPICNVLGYTPVAKSPITECSTYSPFEHPVHIFNITLRLCHLSIYAKFYNYYLENACSVTIYQKADFSEIKCFSPLLQTFLLVLSFRYHT